MASDSSKVLFCKQGVFIHTTVARADEDALVQGKILLVEKPEGLFIEWKAAEDEYDVKTAVEAEWSMVDAVSYKTEKGQENGAVSMASKPQKKHERHKYVINFDLKDLKSFKRSHPNLGWSYLIFILQCGTTCPALHFHQGGTKAFMRELEKYLRISRSINDPCLYLVREQDPQALSRSFNELQLFEDQSSDILMGNATREFNKSIQRISSGKTCSAHHVQWKRPSRKKQRALHKSSSIASQDEEIQTDAEEYDMMEKFIRDPYSTTLGGFSKVTKFLNNTFLIPEAPMPSHEKVADILQEDIAGMDINNQAEPGFEMITRTELPERPEVKRSSPLSPQQWSRHLDHEGKVKDVDALKEAVFRGGIDSTIRVEVWKFLLGYFSWDSTYKMRTEQRKKKVDDYFRMKLQWKSVTEEQERRFSLMRERKNLIDKDVTRTDRTHEFFSGDDNPNIQVLYDILMTYCMYNFDLGYVQGMSDLLAPILVKLENEVDAFWCFAGFMDIVAENFAMDQEGMKQQLLQVHTLVKFIDPQLCNYLESNDSSNMYFCFRWLLIWFKREFNFYDVMTLWEVLWTGKPCPNFHLLICMAILDTEKNLLIENNFGFTEILKRINDMAGNIDLNHSLKKAEGIYLQLTQCKSVPPLIRETFGLKCEDVMDGGSGTCTPGEATAHSTPASTPDQSRHHFTTLKVPDKAPNGDVVASPDDSSIEILAEHSDMFL